MGPAECPIRRCGPKGVRAEYRCWKLVLGRKAIGADPSQRWSGESQQDSTASPDKEPHVWILLLILLALLLFGGGAYFLTKSLLVVIVIVLVVLALGGWGGRSRLR